MPLNAWANDNGTLKTQIELCAPMLVKYKFYDTLTIQIKLYATRYITFNTLLSLIIYFIAR